MIEKVRLNKSLFVSSAAILAHKSGYRIEVQRRYNDPSLQTAITQLGIPNVGDCRKTLLYFLDGDVTDEQIKNLSHELLVDPVTETFTIGATSSNPTNKSNAQVRHTIEVTLLPGVTDPATENLIRAAHLLGITTLERAATGQRYVLDGNINSDNLHKLATGLFSNPVIQRYTIDQPITPPFVEVHESDDTVEIIPLCAADNDELLQISAERRLALDLAEMQAIRAYYRGKTATRPMSNWKCWRKHGANTASTKPSRR